MAPEADGDPHAYLRGAGPRPTESDSTFFETPRSRSGLALLIEHMTDLKPAIAIVESLYGKPEKKRTSHQDPTWDVEGVRISVRAKPTKKPRFGFDIEYEPVIVIAASYSNGGVARAQQTVKLSQKDPKASLKRHVERALEALAEARKGQAQTYLRQAAKDAIQARLKNALTHAGIEASPMNATIGFNLNLSEADAKRLASLLRRGSDT